MPVRTAAGGIPLHWIALAAGALPLLTYHASYLLAAAYAQVDWCLPYWHSCSSISATGRQPPAKLLFKADLVPACVLAMLYWYCMAAWRRQQASTRYPRSLRSLPWLGGMAALFLLQYTVALGEAGDTYRLLRRSGVILAFALTFLAQLQLLRLLGELRAAPWPRACRWLWGLCLALLAVGLGSVLLGAFWVGYAGMEDAVEWWLALLLNGPFLVMAWALRQVPAVLQVRA